MFSNEVSGRINQRVNKVGEFFSLKEQNQLLRDQNAELLSIIPSGMLTPDSSYKFVRDTVMIDSLKNYLQFKYLPAKVISNSVFLQQNYMILHRGSDQEIQPNMAVVGPKGIVGTVVNTSKNMSIVMSLLHRQSKVIVMLKKGSGLGEAVWDGKNPGYLQVTKIPKTVSVIKGDTVVTSPYSDKFPPGVVVGYVAVVSQDKETNTYLLKIKTAVDFNSVQHVFVVKNLLAEEMEELKSKTIKE